MVRFRWKWRGSKRCGIGKTMRSLVWFRSDLRTHDDPALAHACRQSEDGVITVVAIRPQRWSDHDWGAVRVCWDGFGAVLPRVQSQIQSRHIDPTGAFIRRFVPELASLGDRAIHQPCDSEALSLGYPLPTVDHAQARERAIAAFRQYRPR